MPEQRGGLRAIFTILVVLVPLIAGFVGLYLLYVTNQTASITRRNYRLLVAASRELSNRADEVRATASAASQREIAYCRTCDEITKAKTRAKIIEEFRPTLPYVQEYLESIQQPEDNDERADAVSLSAWLQELSGGPFDELIVSRADDATVVAQTTSLGGGIAALQDLFETAAHERGETGAGATKHQPIAEPVTTPNLRSASALPRHVLTPGHPESVRYMNDEYLLYCVPILGALGTVKHLDPAANGKREATNQTAVSEIDRGSLALCGLVSEQRFRSESMSMPPTLLAAITVVMIAALLSWPLLRLRFMGPHERLRAVDAITLVVSYLVLVAGVSFVLLDAHFYMTLRADFDDQLHQVSVQVRDRLRSEIQGGRQQLRAVIEEFEKGYMPQGRRLSLKYWSFDRVVPIGRTGNVRIGWQPEPVSPTESSALLTWQLNAQPQLLSTSVGDRGYFKDAMGGRWWLLRGESGGTCDGDDRFTAEIALTRSTGDYSLVLAVPRRPCADAQLDLWVMSTKLEPFLDAVLPEGFGFAILNAQGQVELGSSMNQAWKEDFLRETESDRTLRAALKTRSAETVSAPYYAHQHRMYLHPIADTPWSLVVYYDLRLLRATNFELITSWLVISSFLLLIYTVSIALFFWFLPGYRARWLWPRREAAAMKLYWLASVALIATALAAYWALSLSDGPSKLIAILLFPAFAASLAALCLGTDALQSSKERASFIAVGLAALGLPALVAVLGNRPIADFTWPVIGLVLLVCGYVSSRFLSRNEHGSAEDDVRRADHEGNPKKRLPPEFRLRWSYCLIPIAFTISVAVMPALVIFMDARDHEITNLTKLGQQYWLESMLGRARSLPKPKKEWDAELASTVRNARLNYSEDLYPSSWLGGALLKISHPVSNSKPVDAPQQVSESGTETQTAHAGSGWKSMTELLQPILPSVAYAAMGSERDYVAELREMTADAAADDSWCWIGNGEDLRIRLNDPSIKTALGSSNNAVTNPFPAGSAEAKKAIQDKRRSNNEPWAGSTWAAALLAASIMAALVWWLAMAVTLLDIGRVAEQVSSGSITPQSEAQSPSEIWPGLTALQKLVLIHVAEEGFLNRKATPVAHKLYRMGLIRFDPALSLRDEALRDYVENAPDSDVVVKLELVDRSAAWAIARVVIAGSLLALAGFLFVTQPGLLGSAIAILTGVGALVPLISRVLGGFTQDRKASGS